MISKNTIENVLIILITIIVSGSTGGYVGYKAAKESASSVFEQHKEIIVESIRKETTSIKNEMNTNFEKIKSNKSEPINIVIDPSTKSVINQADSSQVITVKEEKGFFKRLFSKKK